MKFEALHGWDVGLDEARRIQERLAAQVSRQDEPEVPRFIAGVDVSAGRGQKVGTAAVVVLSYPELNIAEVRIVRGELGYPYIPGFLSFREMPLVLKAFEKLEIRPDFVIVDGQGIAHPRRLGIGSHLGLFLDTPTIGCAKSRLCGTYEVPPDIPGSYAQVSDRGEIIATVLRTKARVKPVFVSIGHKVSLKRATHLVLSCCHGYRLPETTRLAHLAAGGHLASVKPLK
ncbi:MAG: deoxyribonuclease V [Chloroflexota bacterium]